MVMNMESQNVCTSFMNFYVQEIFYANQVVSQIFLIMSSNSLKGFDSDSMHIIVKNFYITLTFYCGLFSQMTLKYNYY